MTERERLQQAILTLEAQRALLGDAAVDAAVAALREKLGSQGPAAPSEEQRKQITVLFADLSGFTAMSEAMDAEEVTALMNSLWERLDRTVVEHGGAIDKHIGDNVMALWGAEQAREDDPERALRAALAIQDGVRAFNEEMRLERPLGLRIGVNTGPVLLGKMGTTGEYTAMGDTVNTASRLEGAAPVGGILISHDTYRHIQGVFDVRALEPIGVKGKREALRVYLVQKAKARAFRLPIRGVEGIETQMVGRSAELERLQTLFRAAMAGPAARFVTVVGDAGIGKSRLLYEFDRWIRLLPEEVFYFKGRATAEGADVPYGLFRDLLSFRFDIRESDSTAAMREKFTRGMGGILEPDRADVVGHFLGFDFSGSEAVRRLLGSPSFGKLAQADLAHYFRAVAQSPTVLFLEDLHWADESSLDLLGQLAGEIAGTRLLLVGLARPSLLERRPQWAPGGTAHLRLELALLSQEQCRKLVGEILQKVAELPDSLRERVVAGAEGNPFYVEELIKMLIEVGVIVRGEERWHVEEDKLARVQLPPTLTGVIQARLDSLPKREKALLQKASVVGRQFWDAVLTELGEGEAHPLLSPGEVTALLEAASGRELVFPMKFSSFEEAREYIFKHAILRDVTYETVLLRVRKVYHGQVARWLEGHVGERRTEYLNAIARHFELAGEPERAALYLLESGRELHRMSSFREAVSAHERALALLPARDARARMAALADLGNSCRFLGEYAKSKACFLESLAAAERAGDGAAEIVAHTGLGRAAQEVGDYDEARTHLDRALDLCRAHGTQEALARVLHSLSDLHFRLGRADDAERCAGQCLAINQELGDRQGIAMAHRVLGFAAMMRGEYEAAGLHHEEHGRISAEIGDRWGGATALTNVGEIYRKRGRVEEAVACWKKSLLLAQEIGNRLGVAIAHCNAGNVLALMAGREQEATGHLREALLLAREIGSLPIALESFVGIMYLKVRSGCPEAAAELAGMVEAHPRFNAEIKGYLDPVLDELGRRMPEEALRQARGRGATMSLDSAIDRVVAEHRGL